MLRKFLTITGFVIIFLAAATLVLYMQKKMTAEPDVEIVETVAEESADTDTTHTYTAETLQSECTSDSNIFCAIERTVKCTINPELEICDKNYVPAFVIGKAEDTERPTEISFRITKIKPIPETSDISVYTQSDCNALWFGLCKGTVVYSLTTKNDDWVVTNIFALED